MPDYRDLVRFVHGPFPAKPLPVVWDFFPCHAGAVGRVPNFVHYYFDVCEKLRIQIKLKELLPECLILPGVFPDLGVVVEASAFGGRVQWFEQGAPFIARALRGLTDIDTLQPPPVGLCGLMPLWLTQREVMHRKLQKRGAEMERWIMCMGPAKVSGLLMGYESFYLNLYDDQRRITRLLSLVTDFLSEWLKKQNEVVGGAEVMCVADHVCSQVKAKQLREFILPPMRELYASFTVPV